jgi:hypothetical protein
MVADLAAGSCGALTAGAARGTAHAHVIAIATATVGLAAHNTAVSRNGCTWQKLLVTTPSAPGVLVMENKHSRVEELGR